MVDLKLSEVAAALGGTLADERDPVITGVAGTSRFGLIQSGALESSNVDLTQQLVNLITAQRNFQANARSMETINSITDTVIQIR